MHLVSTDLDLKWLSGAADQSCMQRLVHVLLRHSDIVFKTTRNWLVHFMDHTKSCITVFYCVYHDTHSKQIVDLIQGLVLL